MIQCSLDATTLCSQCWGPGSIPGQGIRPWMLQERSKSLCTATKTKCSQINKKFKKKERNEEMKSCENLK